MGRRKIEIKKVENLRNRNATFKKRRQGILKKAHELAVLTDTKVTLSIKNGDALENHVFNEQLQSLPTSAIAVGGSTTPAPTAEAVDSPPLDDDVIEDVVVARPPPEPSPHWHLDSADASFGCDQIIDSILDPLALSATNQLGMYNPGFNNFNASRTALEIFSHPLLSDSPNESFLGVEAHDDCNWLMPLLEINPGFASPVMA
ncbi:SRF-type transcription factor family protein [Metarhizium robertsii]|uniref:Transcription factor, MADS-box n=3 Tax=Metarhizium TaxID=5529 RepID=E9EJR7_METRA